MWLCIERKSYFGFENTVRMRAKKDDKGLVYMAMDQKAWEAVKVDLCHDGHELFRIVKQRSGEKKDVVGVSCLKDESKLVKVSVVYQRKSGKSVWKSW